jgi:chromosome segregation ATPase
MDNVEMRINSLKTKLDAKKDERTRAQANLEMAEKQLQDVTAKIKDLGYEPTDLPAVIEQLEKSVSDNLAKAERILSEMDGITTEQVMKEVGLQ